MDDVWLGPHTIGSSRKITSPAGIRLVVTINLPTPSLSSTFQGKHLPSSSLRWSLRCSGEQAKTSPQAGQAEPTAPQKRQGPCFPPPMSGIFSLLIRFCLLFYTQLSLCTIYSHRIPETFWHPAKGESGPGFDFLYLQLTPRLQIQRSKYQDRQTLLCPANYCTLNLE